MVGGGRAISKFLFSLYIYVGVLTSFAPLWMSTPKPEESSDPPVDPENIQHNDEDDTYNPNADGFQSRVCSPDTAGDASEMEQIGTRISDQKYVSCSPQVLSPLSGESNGVVGKSR